MGTLVTVVIPIVFYHRAYSDTEKNLQKDKGSRKASSPTPRDFPYNEQDPLLIEEDVPRQTETNVPIEQQEENISDYDALSSSDSNNEPLGQPLLTPDHT